MIAKQHERSITSQSTITVRQGQILSMGFVTIHETLNDWLHEFFRVNFWGSENEIHHLRLGPTHYQGYRVYICRGGY
jgi:hypothetical protein